MSVAASTKELPLPDGLSASLGETPRVGPPVTPDAPAESPDKKSFSRYNILGEIGRGGMGIVYKTYDPKLKRVVALKVLLSGDAASGEEVERFFREAESAASLHHPNIVPIHELDVHEGKHFFTMDFVEGKPLSKVIRETDTGMEPRRAVEIIRDVAKAVHHAHESGVIHRDLKPANILVTPDGRPMVTDFGLAKQVKADTSLTHSGTALGTPSYMAPEQARGRVKEIDARTDVYSLGAVLYEAVTGLPPFTGATPFEIMEKVAYADPIPPRVFNRACPQDVETIALKCLEKERGRRYASASDLADDCGRYLAGDAIAARPASVIYRVRKRLARHRAVAAVSTIALAALIALAAWSYVRIVRERNEALRQRDAAERERDRAVKAEKKEAAQRALAESREKEAEAARAAETEERQRADSERENAEYELYVSSIGLAQKYWDEADIGKMQKLLKACPARFRGWEWGRLNNLLHQEARQLERREGRICSLALSPDGKIVASHQQTVNLWDFATGKRSLSIDGAASSWSRPTFSPDSRLLATRGREDDLKIWDVASGKAVRTIPGKSGAVAMSPDGKLVARVAADRTVELLDADSGIRTALFPSGATGTLPVLVFSPDGKHVAAGGTKTEIMVWDVDGRNEAITMKAPRSWAEGRGMMVLSLAFSPDGKYLLSGDLDGPPHLWDPMTGDLVHTFCGHVQGSCVCFSPSGRKIATGGYIDGVIQVWDTATGELDLAMMCGNLLSLSFGPDDNTILSGHNDGTVKIWNTEVYGKPPVLEGHGSAVTTVAFSDDGTRLLSAGQDGKIGAWETVARSRSFLELRRKSAVHSSAFAPDGTRVALGYDDSVNTYDLTAGTEDKIFSTHGGKAIALAYSQDCRLLACGTRHEEDKQFTVLVWDVGSGKEIALFEDDKGNTRALAFSPCGRYVASGGWGGITRLWDVAGRRELLSLDEPPEGLRPGHAVLSLAFSPTGATLHSGHWYNNMATWDVRTGRLLRSERVHSLSVSALTMWPDGSRLVSCGSDDRTVRVVDAATGRDLMTVDTGLSPQCADVSPDGLHLAVGFKDGSIRIYEADPWWEPGNPPKRPEPVKIEIKPVPEAMPGGAPAAEGADEQF